MTREEVISIPEKSMKWFRISAAVLIIVIYICGCVARMPTEEVDLSPDVVETPQRTARHTIEPTKTPMAVEAFESDEQSSNDEPEPTPPNYRPSPGDLGPMPQLETYRELKKKNTDVMGWLIVPNTKVDYPVVRTNNNDYYLENTAEKKQLKAGAIFMDYRNADPWQQRHVIIYGHNMKSGSMFGTLDDYKNKKFYENNKTITLYWGEQPVQYEVYNAFVATEDVDFIRTEFNSGKSFETYMNDLKDKSKYKSDITITQDDQVLTLMTCSYEKSNARFVIQARRIQAG